MPQKLQLVTAGTRIRCLLESKAAIQCSSPKAHPINLRLFVSLDNQRIRVIQKVAKDRVRV